jgi:sugar/nucleoside kinase (ribokinase family)
VTVTAVTTDGIGQAAVGPAVVVDPFGAGDAGMAACLAALHARAPLDSIAAATAHASALQHTVVGDLWRLGRLTGIGHDHRRIHR